MCERRSRHGGEDAPVLSPQQTRWQTLVRDSVVQIKQDSKAQTVREPGQVLALIASSAGTAQLEKLCGTGAYAAVYRGWVTMDCGGERREAAIKVMNRTASLRARDVYDFTLEASLLQRCQHQSIVSYIGVGTCPCPGDPKRALSAPADRMFLATEYLAGGSIASLLTRQMLSPRTRLYSGQDALRWSLQIAEALQYLHNSTPMLIHRDLKADNIIFADPARSQCKLIDFGLHQRIQRKWDHGLDQACSEGGEGSCADSDSTKGAETNATEDTDRLQRGSQNSAGGFRKPSLRCAHLNELSISAESAAGDAYKLTGLTGSLCYMSPEVYRQEAYNEKVDIFSLGVIMYELFARVRLAVYFKDSDHLHQHIHKVCYEGFRPAIPAFVPAAVRAIIEHCWAATPADRYSADELVDALLEAQQSYNDKVKARCCTVS